MEVLENELKTFADKLPSLLEYEGRFAVVRGDEVGGIFETYEDALQEGYRRYKLEPFLVKKIESVEQVLFFSRDISCHTSGCQ